MLSSIKAVDGRIFAHDPSVRGYTIVYRQDAVNHCPGCGRSHWIIGRLSAECAFCATALPLADAHLAGPGVLRRPRTGLLEAA